MRRLLLPLVLILPASCGGKIFGATSGPTDSGVAGDSNDPLGGGGHLLSGTCHFTSSFRPNGADWIPQTDTDAVATGSRPGAGLFTMLCAGRGNESFYYETTAANIPLMVGTFMVMGQLNQVSNGREAEVTDWGSCTVVVQSIGKVEGHDFVTGTFDCPELKTLTGAFWQKGTFSVPLP